MEITEQTMYWVLILDNIHKVLPMLIGLGVFFGLLLGVIPWILHLAPNSPIPKAVCILSSVLSVGLLCLAAICIACTMFLPTTKQMAAIHVVPKIATNENFQTAGAEFKELYNLAKAGLSQAISIKTPQKSKE